MMILPSKSRGLEFWSLNDTSIHENSEWNVFKNTRFSGQISNNWPNDIYCIIQDSWILLITNINNITMF